MYWKITSVWPRFAEPAATVDKLAIVYLKSISLCFVFLVTPFDLWNEANENSGYMCKIASNKLYTNNEFICKHKF